MLAEPVALIDMDGTIADFDQSMRHYLSLIRSPEETKPDDYSGEDQTYVKQRHRLIKKLPGFWRNLPRLQAGFDIVNTLMALKFRCNILSKGPRKSTAAWQEKVEWCEEHVPHMPITLSEDKGLVYGKVLVDDWPAYVERWIKWRPRGLVISVAQPWNKNIEKLGPNVIRYDGSQMPEIFSKLQKIRGECE